MERARAKHLVPTVALALAIAAPCTGCSSRARSRERAGGAGSATEHAFETAPPANDAEERARLAELDREFPLHGVVTGLQIVVRDEPRPDAKLLGWLRIGARVRLKPGPTRSSTCATGWYRVSPTGWACAGEGIIVAATPPESPIAIAAAPRDAPLPYPYYFVKDPLVPEYNVIPSRDQQRDALAWGDRYLQVLAQNESRARRMRAAGVPGEEPPAAVRRYLDRGFFVAGSAIEVRAFRRFVRTVRGRYIKEAQIEPRQGSSFHGVELGRERTLPVAWVVRASRPLIKRDRADGTTRFVEDPAREPLVRLAITPWIRRENIGGRTMHVIEEGRYLNDWFIALAERIDPPRGVRDGEPWVHIDLGEQTLVLYRGRTPIYATLVSSGLAGHDTPLGEFTIRAKHVAATMSDLGADTEEQYSIEDVPWTQYFSGSLALHGAFWHDRWGLKHSHGCVNLAPLDAHRVFNETWPSVPDGWHGVSTDRTGLRGSRVVITQ